MRPIGRIGRTAAFTLLLGALTQLAPLPAWAAGTEAAAGTGIGLDVTVEPRTVTVGDRVQAVLTLTAAAGAVTGEPRFPSWRDRWGHAEVLEAGSVERARDAGGRAVWRQRLVLAIFRPGTVALPPRAVQVPTAAGTVEATTGRPPGITVTSVLPPTADPATLDPTPAAPIRRLPLGTAFWWTLAAGAAAAASMGAIALLATARRRRLDGGRAAPSRPPFDELAARLDGLLAAPPEQMETAYVTLSHTLRCYLGRRLGFPATESTTTEVRRRLRSHRLPETVVEPALLVLQRCDGVKFARARADAGTWRSGVAAAREFARVLELHLAPAETGSERGAVTRRETE